MTTAAPNNGLEQVFPVTEVLDLGGETLELSPLKLGEIPKFLAVFKSISVSFTDDGAPLLDVFAGEHGEAMIEALAIAVRRPVAWVADLELNDAVRLATKIIEVNADFFVAQVAPAFTALVERLTQKTDGLLASRH